MTNYCFKLWKPKVESQEVRFVRVDDLPNSGFISVYNFSDPDAVAMQELGSYKQFKGVVHSTHLLIDADTESAAKTCQGRLQALGIAFDVYTTGNRGLHFHVPREARPSQFLPQMDKEWVKDNLADVDMSIYHHVAMYRQVGAVHKKTGKRKDLIESVPGNVLTLSSMPNQAVQESAQYDNTTGMLQSVFQDRTLQLLTVPIVCGERRAKYIEIGLALFRLNQPFDYAMAYLDNVNAMAEAPLPIKDLQRLLTWVYYERSVK